MLLDLCTTLYGPADRTMMDVFTLLDRSFTEADVHATTWRLPDPRAICGETRRQEVARLLDRAMDQTKPDAKAHARVVEVLSRWQDGWRTLETLKLPAENVEMYNPAVGK